MVYFLLTNNGLILLLKQLQLYVVAGSSDFFCSKKFA